MHPNKNYAYGWDSLYKKIYSICLTLLSDESLIPLGKILINPEINNKYKAKLIRRAVAKSRYISRGNILFEPFFKDLEELCDKIESNKDLQIRCDIA